jgi:hypothetical protein
VETNCRFSQEDLESSSVKQSIKAELSQSRKPGRPATQKDKNGRPVPVRADRDQPMKSFFESIPPATFEEVVCVSDEPKFLDSTRRSKIRLYQTTSRMTLCRNFGISLRDLLNVWFSYMRDLGRLAIFTRLPEIAQQTAEDALSREVACGCCDGMGKVMNDEGQQSCPMCQGAGKIQMPADKDARRLVLEIAGLTGRNKVSVVAIQQNCGVNLEDNVREIEKILMEPDS